MILLLSLAIEKRKKIFGDYGKIYYTQKRAKTDSKRPFKLAYPLLDQNQHIYAILKSYLRSEFLEV